MLKYPRLTNLAWSVLALHVPAQNCNINDDNDDKGINIKEIEDASQGGVVFIDCDLKIVHNMAY
jgi:hypothetical protein